MLKQHITLLKHVTFLNYVTFIRAYLGGVNRASKEMGLVVKVFGLLLFFLFSIGLLFH